MAAAAADVGDCAEAAEIVGGRDRRQHGARLADHRRVEDRRFLGVRGEVVDETGPVLLRLPRARGFAKSASSDPTRRACRSYARMSAASAGRRCAAAAKRPNASTVAAARSKMPCAASSRSIRSRASASSPVRSAISAGVAPAGPTASAAPQSAMTCRQRATMWALARSATSSAGSWAERPEALTEPWRYWLAARCKSMVMPRLRR